MEEIEGFIDILGTEAFVQATLSKPRQFSPYKNIFIRPIDLKDKDFQVTFRTDTQDQVQNFRHEDIKVQLHLWLIQYFFFIDMKTKTEDLRLMQSKKGKVTVTRKKANNTEVSQEHDREKKRHISADARFLQVLEITSKSGKIYNHTQRKYKQLNHFIELIAGFIDEKEVSTVTDMGSGKGYLTFALYDYLSRHNEKVSIEGIELRKDLVDKCQQAARNCRFSNLSFRQGNIEDIQLQDVDMVIALHACDIATDMAIAKGVQANAKYIAVAPCCHKQIRKAMGTPLDALAPMLRYGIFEERQAEMITDAIRALLLESKGYAVKVFEFIATEHTPKNIIITAKYIGRPDPKALEKIKQLKAVFGIEKHYLEEIIDA